MITSSTSPLAPQAGSYHYVSGVDVSSSASLVAYINSLTYSIEGPQAWFTKGATWKVKLVLVGHYFVWHIRVLSDVVICRAQLSSKALAWAYKNLEPGPGRWLRLSLAGLRLKPRLQSEREMRP